MSRRPSRRRILALLSGMIATSLAGCAEVARSVTNGGPQSGGPDAPASPTPAHRQTPKRPTKSPGYKDYHWHGRLFFEINGELVDFTEPKYHLENIEDDEALGFHFHESAHGPNEWSNELAVVTLAEGLNLLPGIGYEQGPDGGHVVTYEETTYREQAPETEISIHEGTFEIDPIRHYVRHGEVYWVRVTTEAGRMTPPDDHPDARIGTLLVDINNVRLDPSSAATGAPNGDESAFHFHDDGHPYRWFVGGDGVTLAGALDSLEGLSFGESSGGPVVSVEEPSRFGVSEPEKYVETYRAADPGTTVTIRQRTTDVELSGYTLSHGDIIWVYVHTDQAPENEH